MEQTKNSPDQEEESIHSREWSWENREMERWKDGGMEGWTDSRTKKKKVYSF